MLHGQGAVAIDAALAARFGEAFDQAEHIDWFERRTTEFGIDAAGVRNFGDQPVDPQNVVCGNGGELAAQFGLFDPVE